MKVLCWNVNGIRALFRNINIIDFFEKYKDVDVMCFQELKAQEQNITEILDTFKQMYPFISISCAVKKGYSGVMICSKTEFNEILIPDDEGRIVCVEFDDIILFNVYVMNSKSKLTRIDERLEFDEMFYDQVYERINEETSKTIIVCGDLNSSLSELDYWNSNNHKMNIPGYSKQEINSLKFHMKRCKLIDTFRHFTQSIEYSFYTYRNKMRSKNKGFRLDYFLTNNINKVTSSIINKDTGSDHLPIILTLKE